LTGNKGSFYLARPLLYIDVQSGQIRDRVWNSGQFSFPNDLVFFRDRPSKFGTVPKNSGRIVTLNRIQFTQTIHGEYRIIGEWGFWGRGISDCEKNVRTLRFSLLFALKNQLYDLLCVKLHCFTIILNYYCPDILQISILKEKIKRLAAAVLRVHAKIILFTETILIKFPLKTYNIGYIYFSRLNQSVSVC